MNLILILKDLNNKSFNILDIGSGNGENAIYLSKLYPNSRIITCEIFEDGNINLINQIINYILIIFVYLKVMLYNY